MKNYRVVSKTRFITFLVVVFLLMIMTVGPMMGLNNADSTAKMQYQCVEIQYGDTLWEIAQEYAPNVDSRKVVYDICEYNDIDASDIVANQEILVPVYD